MTTRVSPGGLQPSQPFVDAERLRGVLEWFDPDAPAYDPIPVLPAERFDPGLDADFVIVDGHTRAFVAVLCGAERVRVVRDLEGDDPPIGIYRTCVEWCQDAGVTEPADLVGCVVAPRRFARSGSSAARRSNDTRARRRAAETTPPRAAPRGRRTRP